MHANPSLTKAIRFALISSASLATITSGYANAADGDKVERIQVTGSRIQRTDLETANPITVFDAKDIEQTGVSTISDFLRTNVAAGGFNESSTLSQAAGASSVGLRGFSSDFTLILLNGHRLPKNSAGGIFTDINQIPLAAVKRIDILPDGASAIYGSDAVAGVINIITKTDFEGLALSAKYGAAVEHFDANEANFSIVGGASNEKTNLLFTAEHFERDKVMASDRELGGSAYIPGHPGGEGRSSFGIPGFTSISVKDGVTIPGITDGDIGSKAWSDCPADQISNGRCRYDFAPLYQLQPESERQSIYTQLTHQAMDDLILRGEFRYSRAYTLTSNAPAPGVIDVSNSPFLNDFLRDDRFGGDATKAQAIMDAIAAGNASVSVGRRYLDFPNREKDNTNETFEAVAGFNYTINDDWGLDFNIGHSRLTNRQIGAAGQLLEQQVEDAFNSSNAVLNPFKKNTCEGLSAEDCITLQSTLDSLQAAIHRTGEYTINFSTLTVSGLPGVELPGGEIGVAAGIDTRREQYIDRSDPSSVAGEVIGGAASNGGGSFENYAGFVELSLPVIEGMDVNLAARYDKADWGISDEGKATYSAKISYRPIDDLLLRGSYGTGFKAPNLSDLFLSSSEGVVRAIDTTLCNAAGNDQTNGDCQLQEINSQSGGNPALTSETSKSYNVGAVYQVTDELSAALDYWSLEVDNIVGSLGVQEILNIEAKPVKTPEEQELIDQLISRDPNTGRVDSTSDGFVKSNLQNLNAQNAKGLTYSVDYTSELSGGDFGANLKIEQYLSRESQAAPGQPLCDSIKDDAARKYRVNGGVSYGANDYEVSLNMRFLPGFDDYDQRNTIEDTCELIGHYNANTKLNDDGHITSAGDPQHVASYFQMDLTSTYHFLEDNSVTFGVRNILDKQPVFSSPKNWPFYDQGSYDNIGRFVYLQIDSKF
ncbi:TonB-dependent receptor [Parashewanella spongiae]|uniref:TonB-dependent receptor n=1 Tax=Parashewanella spongiae TaxID=342950 RepID=A0A3A6TYN5_9GAMM|nr:TonB-dependent receptor [Parashewanella spongiae]MCL1077969.1 TonB-dependent receptor [Parashewanella spongiae]RJY16906.1 TonB-dependent receptor [Parashewanella spongiae]